jgi:hypothetical protein
MFKKSNFPGLYLARMGFTVRVPDRDIAEQGNCNHYRHEGDTINNVGVERTPKIPG